MSPLARLLSLFVQLYRLGISPVIPAHCRYHPTCSGYALQALRDHGAWRGGWLAVRRLCRCHPWGGSGYDPVPPPRMQQAQEKERLAGPGNLWHEVGGCNCSGPAPGRPDVGHGLDE